MCLTRSLLLNEMMVEHVSSNRQLWFMISWYGVYLVVCAIDSPTCRYFDPTRVIVVDDGKFSILCPIDSYWYQVASVKKLPSLPGTDVMLGSLIWIKVTELGGIYGQGVVSFLFRHIMSYTAVGIFG